MAKHIHIGDIALFLISLPLETWLAVLLLRRRAYLQYRLFVVYIVSSAVVTTLRLVVYLLFSYYYYYFYWDSEILLKLLAVLALYEVFHRVFAAFYVYRWFWLVFPAFVTLILLIALWYNLQNPPVKAPTSLKLVLNSEVGINLIETALFALFFGLAAFFNVRWQSYSRSIVEGFAALGLAGLAYAMRSMFGPRWNTIASYTPPVSHVLAVLLWLDGFRRRPSIEPEWRSQINPRQMLEEVRKYLSILRGFRGKRK